MTLQQTRFILTNQSHKWFRAMITSYNLTGKWELVRYNMRVCLCVCVRVCVCARACVCVCVHSSLSFSATASSFAFVRLMRTTFRPCLASSWQYALPMPSLAPVTTEKTLQSMLHNIHHHHHHQRGAKGPGLSVQLGLELACASDIPP